MTFYVVTGRLGGGKSLVSVGRIGEYLKRGAKVATNLDIHVSAAPASWRKGRLVRLPDMPSVDDFEALGVGNESTDEDKNGLVVLDECGVLFNAREWADKGRQAIIDWLLHSRKLGWDVIIIVQALSLLDKQVRDALCEMHAFCKRLDRVKMPVVGTIARALSFGLWSGRFPRMHVAVVTYGHGQGAAISERWWFNGSDLFACYDTRQRFSRTRTDGPWSMLWPHEFTAPDRGRTLKPKLPAVELVMRLPAHERPRHLARLQRLGLA